MTHLICSFEKARTYNAWLHKPVPDDLLRNIGYGDPTKLMPRGPRLDFSEACTLL